MRFGVIITCLWCVAWFIIAWWSGDADRSAMPLNAWGDFLSGVVAPLAFLWLILGYLQQGEELKLNTRALERQERELARTAEETAALVRETVRSAQAMESLAQAAATQAEQAQRQADLAQEQADSMRRHAWPTFQRGVVRTTGGQASVDLANRGGRVSEVQVLACEGCTTRTRQAIVDTGEHFQVEVFPEVPGELQFTVRGRTAMGELVDTVVQRQHGEYLVGRVQRYQT